MPSPLHTLCAPYGITVLEDRSIRKRTLSLRFVFSMSADGANVFSLHIGHAVHAQILELGHTYASELKIKVSTLFCFAGTQNIRSREYFSSVTSTAAVLRFTAPLIGFLSAVRRRFLDVKKTVCFPASSFRIRDTSGGIGTV